MPELPRRRRYTNLVTPCLIPIATMYREMDMQFWLEKAEAEGVAPAQAGTTATPSTPRKSRSNVATKRAARLRATVTMAASAGGEGNR